MNTDICKPPIDVIFNWSSGKDSAIALQALLSSTAYNVRGLLTTVTRDYNRISMHGVHCDLLELQAAALGFVLNKIYIQVAFDDEHYENAMKTGILEIAKTGVKHMAFGDIFLEDLKLYREKKLAEVGFSTVFPIWKKDTTMLAKRFIADGFKAVLTCIDSEIIPKEFAGREFNESLLKDLPNEVDPCGENGEFHTFVYDGPIFKNALAIEKGEIIPRDNRFFYCDLKAG